MLFDPPPSEFLGLSEEYACLGIHGHFGKNIIITERRVV